jgi:hypothetical protein
MEVPVKRLFQGLPLSRAVSKQAVGKIPRNAAIRGPRAVIRTWSLSGWDRTSHDSALAVR